MLICLTLPPLVYLVLLVRSVHFVFILGEDQCLYSGGATKVAPRFGG